MVDGIELDDYSKKAGYDENGIEKKWLTKGQIELKIPASAILQIQFG